MKTLNWSKLNKYYKKYKPPLLAVDAIVNDKSGRILLMKRNIEPFRGKWVFPGGHSEYGETTEDAVLREVREETGLRCKIKSMLGVYSDPKRDPRVHTISIVYVLTMLGGKLRNSWESTEQKFFNINALPKNLGFDHAEIIKDYKQFLKKSKK